MAQVDLDLTLDEDEPKIVFGYKTQDGNFVPIEQCFQTNLKVHYQRLKSQKIKHTIEVKEIESDDDILVCTDEDSDDVGSCHIFFYI